MNKKSIKKYVAGAAGVGAGILGGKGGSGLSGLMGGMEGLDIGGMASKLGGTIGMMINANKKDPNPGRPYNKGTKMIKYQAGVEDITPITPKMASLRMPQEAPMSPRPSKVPVEKQSRRERKAENKKLEALVKAPIIYNESSFVGPMNQEPKKSTPILDNLIKRSMSSQAFKETMPNRAGLVSFKDMTPAQQKQYRAGVASGREFTVEGIGKYGAASKEQRVQSAKMAGKSTSAKPLVKIKEDSWNKAQWDKFIKDRNAKLNTSSSQSKFTDINIPVGISANIQDRIISTPTDNTRVNINIPSFKKSTDEVGNIIRRKRETYKKEKEQEKAALKESGKRYEENLKKENPQAYERFLRYKNKKK